MSVLFSGRRTGILLHGSKLWISELASIYFAVTLAAVLISFSTIIIRNEFTIYNTTGQITSKKSDRIILAHSLEEVRERAAIIELLRSITNGKLSDESIVSLSDIVLANSRQYGYDPLLLLAVIRVESVFKATAKGRYRSGAESGALGLMQLKLETANEIAARLNMDPLSNEDLLIPETNVILGAAYLTTMINRFKSFKLGLLAYNQGPGLIRKTLSENAPLSIRYYRKVLDAYYDLKQTSLQLAARDMTASSLHR